MVHIKSFIYNFLIFLILFLGFFGLFVVSHELYHHFSIGESTGICFGNCLTDEHSLDTGKAVTYFDYNKLENIDKNIEERNAYIFCSSFTFLVLLLIIYFGRENV